MAVISVDLASKDYCDIGVVVLDRGPAEIDVQPVALTELGLRGVPDARVLTRTLLELAADVKARWILLDGPQGWRAPQSQHRHCRHCERELSTQGKTGLPGNTKPGNYLGFISFAISVFDELATRNWPRWTTAALSADRAGFTVESFPTSAWRSLDIRPLPGKSAATQADIDDRLAGLKRVFGIQVARGPSHDELQALVSGLAGLALEAGNVEGIAVCGVPPFEVEGTWREGFIINPTRHAAQHGMQPTALAVP
jgi:hypothetical protein